MVHLHPLVISSLAHFKSSPLLLSRTFSTGQAFWWCVSLLPLLIPSLFFQKKPEDLTPYLEQLMLRTVLFRLIWILWCALLNSSAIFGFSHSCPFVITIFVIFQLLCLNSLTIYIVFLFSKYNAFLLWSKSNLLSKMCWLVIFF